MEPLRWTAHMEDCLRELREQGEDPLDEPLVELVNIQLIVIRAGETACYDRYTGTSAGHDNQSTLYPQALLMQLESVDDQMSHAVKQQPIIQFHLSTARLIIAELALAGDPALSTPTTNNQPHPNLQRLRYLHLLLRSITAWQTTYRTLTLHAFRSLPMTLMLQSRFSTGLLFVLTTLTNEPAWLTREEVRATVDLLECLEFSAEAYARVAETVGLDAGPYDVKGSDIFTLASGRTRKILGMWRAQLEPPPPPPLPLSPPLALEANERALMRCGAGIGEDGWQQQGGLPVPGQMEIRGVQRDEAQVHGLEEINWAEVDLFMDSLFAL
ncbi:hypothetical protein LTR62_004603 [Meristemomyces frigidus]|uniref:Uncharacterized protein n=1 Tax=Meristemomyces frigidus TaxID=1508187 RepID=A0AAN7TGH2_9PEZI|nr:hypothetical protein LTR62_004603 [Meristemomyces frigidus]